MDGIEAAGSLSSFIRFWGLSGTSKSLFLLARSLSSFLRFWALSGVSKSLFLLARSLSSFLRFWALSGVSKSLFWLARSLSSFLRFWALSGVSKSLFLLARSLSSLLRFWALSGVSKSLFLLARSLLSFLRCWAYIAWGLLLRSTWPHNGQLTFVMWTSPPQLGYGFENAIWQQHLQAAELSFRVFTRKTKAHGLHVSNNYCMLIMVKGRTSHCRRMVKVSTWSSLNWTPTYTYAHIHALLSIYSLLLDNEVFFRKSAKFEVNNCCVEASDDINVRLWHPGEQTEVHRQTDRQTSITCWPRRDLGLKSKTI